MVGGWPVRNSSSVFCWPERDINHQVHEQLVVDEPIVATNLAQGTGSVGTQSVNDKDSLGFNATGQVLLCRSGQIIFRNPPAFEEHKNTCGWPGLC